MTTLFPACEYPIPYSEWSDTFTSAASGAALVASLKMAVNIV